MYLAGISVRRVEDITEALWGTHERSVSETLTHYAFPDIHWQKICTTIPPSGSERASVDARVLLAHSPTASHRQKPSRLARLASPAPPAHEPPCS